MGRPKQTGFEYFPFDSTFFDDIKVRKLIRGGNSEAANVYICALCFIFKEGYYLAMDDDFPFFIYEKTGIDEVDVKRCLERCVDVGLFDKGLYEKGILTSAGIQKRYKKICSQSRRVNAIDEYNLIDDAQDSDKDEGNAEQTEVSSEETIFSNEETQVNSAKMPQSKVKKSKVNNPPISNEIVPPSSSEEIDKPPEAILSAPVEIAPKTLEQRRHDFGQALIPYIEKYGKDMIRAFFNYWTEVNDGGRLMAWEKAKGKKGTFNIAGRLAKWHENEERYGTSGGGGVRERGISISTAIQASFIPEETIDMNKLIGDQ